MRHSNSPHVSLIHTLAWVCGVGFSGQAYAQNDDFETLAAELARLRTEVESLSQSIQDVREEARLKLRNITSQKASLEGEIQREELRLKQIRQNLGEVQRRIQDAGALQRELKPSVLEVISSLRPPIENGLPFRTQERLRELDKLASDLKNDVIAPSSVVARLWASVEDEFRLARENGLYQQTITVEGEEILVDVARTGMVMLYFRTPDKRYGFAKRSGNGWTWELFTNSVDDENAARFFESLDKRIRVGFFDLPGAPLSAEALR